MGRRSDRMVGMKSGQFSLRRLFWVVTVFAVYCAIWFGIMHYRERKTREALVKGYRDTRAIMEAAPGGNSEQVRKMLDDNWKKNSKEPIPEYPEPK